MTQENESLEERIKRTYVHEGMGKDFDLSDEAEKIWVERIFDEKDDKLISLAIRKTSEEIFRRIREELPEIIDRSVKKDGHCLTDYLLKLIEKEFLK